MFPKYPNTPTAAERRRHTLHKLAQAAAAVLLTAAAIVYFAAVLIKF